VPVIIKLFNTAVHFWLRILYPTDSHSVNVLNYAWFRRPPVREAEPVQNLLGDRPGSIRQKGTKGLTFKGGYVIILQFFSVLYKAESDF
jgi:hypothetical protein